MFCQYVEKFCTMYKNETFLKVLKFFYLFIILFFYIKERKKKLRFLKHHKLNLRTLLIFQNI